jgi:predicted O-linked N-acetylglucosamine transferase (SPINDLY family)
VGTIESSPALANGHITFGSFNNLAKMNAAVVRLWARVLQAVPGSRLLLKAGPLADAGVRQDVATRFALNGIDAERLLLEPLVPRAEYLKPFNRIDIALDPFPYPGITTSVECLWMGVPFVTLAGQTFMARQGVGLLNNAGLTDWIAADQDDYVARAARHASDLQNLQYLRHTLRQRLLASPIFDALRFATHFEQALRGMWRRWCSAQSRGRVS